MNSEYLLVVFIVGISMLLGVLNGKETDRMVSLSRQLKEVEPAPPAFLELAPRILDPQADNALKANKPAAVTTSTVQRPFKLEIAMIAEPSNIESKSFMEKSFPGLSYQHWTGVHVEGGCPTVMEPLGMVDNRHDPTQLVGCALAHKIIWEDFLFRDVISDADSYLLIFEHDAACAVPGCGDLAIEAIR